MKILRIRLVEAAPIGRGAVVEKQIGYDSRIDGVTPTLSFTRGGRFIQVTFPGKEYVELIPLTNVATIMVQEDGAA